VCLSLLRAWNGTDAFCGLLVFARDWVPHSLMQVNQLGGEFDAWVQRIGKYPVLEAGEGKSRVLKRLCGRRKARCVMDSLLSHVL